LVIIDDIDKMMEDYKGWEEEKVGKK